MRLLNWYSCLCFTQTQNIWLSFIYNFEILHCRVFFSLTFLSALVDSYEMTPASVHLHAPNGVKWSQPTGLFINNEFVNSTEGNTITSIDPA